MNSKLKKRCIRCGALMAATAVVAGIFFQTTLFVEAAMEKMPGIETIVKDNSKDKPFRILELTDNSEDAEIGYYISGQEPSVKLYTYEYQDASGNTQTVHFQTFEEGLAKLPEIQRKEFAMNVKLDENGNINADASTGIQKINMTASDADTAPLSYSDYQEKYFLDNSDRTEDWTKIDLTDLQGKNRTDTVKINGTYQENAAGMVIIQKKSKNIIRFVKALKVISSNLKNSEKILKVFLMLRQNQMTTEPLIFCSLRLLIIQM